MLNLKEIANTVFENNLRTDQITWLAGAVCSLYDDDFVEDVILAAVGGEPWVHPSMSIFRELPDWAQDREGFMEWACQKGILGFVVKVSTPKPVKFHSETSYTTYSFGYTASTHIYVDDLAEVVPTATKWRDELVKKLYQEATE